MSATATNTRTETATSISASTRLTSLEQWVQQQLTALVPEQAGDLPLNIVPLAGDASFRRYFRVQLPTLNNTLVLVDAPPPESLEPFVSIAQAYQQAGVVVPKVLASSTELGAMLQEDLGDNLLLQVVQHATQQQESSVAWYQQALATLPAIMAVKEHRLGALPAYDGALLARENALFHDWLLGTHLQLSLSSAEQEMWQQFNQCLIDNALQQPQVGVHRDYHSRNIMCVPGQKALGVIDFQDAVVGPITYDAVSLLRDCYWVLPTHEVDDLQRHLFNLLQQQGLLATTVNYATWRRWFDVMGLQRHTKAAGIFARLYHRDGKAGYLADIPTTVGYLQRVAALYPEFADYYAFISNKVLPAIAAKNAEQSSK